VKTKENNASVNDFISSVKSKRRRSDSLIVLGIMQAVTGLPARMWGPSIIGFDKNYYKYADGRDGEICMIGFSPRAQALAFYLTTKFENGEALLKQLGKHKFGPGGCLYINKLDDVDLDTLKKVIASSYAHNKNKQR